MAKPKSKSKNTNLSATEVVDLELARYMSNYYRDRFRVAVKLLMWLIVLAFLLMGVGIYIYTQRPHLPQKYYASNMVTGHVEEMYALSSATVKSDVLLKWVQDKILTIYNFNFVNYRDIFARLQNDFSNNGWRQFDQIVSNSAFMNQVTSQQLFVTAILRGKPVIVESGITNSSYSWKINVPILLTLKKSGDGVSAQEVQKPLLVTVIVVRVPDLDQQNAIAIDTFEVT